MRMINEDPDWSQMYEPQPRKVRKRQTLGRYEVCDALKITLRALLWMQRHPSFPRCIPNDGYSDGVGWWEDEIALFKEEMQEAEYDGWKVPEYFFVKPRDPELI